MELSDQELEGLERYFTGAISVADREALEKRLKNDKAFSEEANSFLSVVATLERSKMKTHEIHFDTPLQVSWIRQWWWAMAAVLVGLVASVWWISGNSKKQEGSYLIAKNYFMPYISKTLTSSENSAVSKGISLYENKKYKDAIPILLKETQGLPSTYKTFLLANAYIMENNAGLAIPILLEMERTQSAPPNVETKWYVAIAYLYENKVSDALPYLNALASSNSMYKEKAKQVLADLKSISNQSH